MRPIGHPPRRPHRRTIMAALFAAPACIVLAIAAGISTTPNALELAHTLAALAFTILLWLCSALERRRIDLFDQLRDERANAAFWRQRAEAQRPEGRRP